MSFPIESASRLVDELNTIASAKDGNVFVGKLESDARGDDYRTVKVDITRRDWHRIHPTLISAGWSTFGDDCLVHTLPYGSYLIAEPSF
jgi:hypothetical protein